MKITASLPNYKTIKQDSLIAFFFEDKDTTSFSALKDADAQLIDNLVEQKFIKSSLATVTPRAPADNWRFAIHTDL